MTTAEMLDLPVKKGREVIREKLLTNDEWLVRGLLAIYDCQTSDEQTEEQTKHHNSVGFNGLDAKFLSSLAMQVKQWLKDKEESKKNPAIKVFPTPLSARQMELLRKKMLKYSGQLFVLAQQKRGENERTGGQSSHAA